MCGICGVINLAGKPVAAEQVTKMCDMIRHRGPDDAGVYTDRHVALGSRRLSIIDLSPAGHQPMSNEDESIWVAFNGEIYNFRELIPRLRAGGHQFKSRTDTEVILHAYEQYGEQCVEGLRGMWAFAVWDSCQQKLFISRDRLGEKPLYYCRHGDTYYFASEIKAILAGLGDAAPAPDLSALDTYLTLGYVPAPLTMFEGILKLPPGHSLIIQNGCQRLSKYWDIDAVLADAPRSTSYYVCRLRELLDESVRMRLISDVPLGALLSGGIDSSSIVALMTQIEMGPVKTFSVGFADPKFDELDYAHEAAAHFGTEHHELVVPDCSPALMEKIAWHLDEPISDAAAIPTYLVCQLAKNLVTVVLTGDGGDELFGGYDHYGYERMARYYELLPGWIRARLLPQLLAKTGLTFKRKIGRAVWCGSVGREARLGSWHARFSDPEKTLLYADEFEKSLDDNDVFAAIRSAYRSSRSEDDLNRLLYVDLKVCLPDDFLMKVDKMSMAVSLESRAPLLDHKLVEFVASIPSSVKFAGDRSKYLLRETMSPYLPPRILGRRKQGFNVPIGRWLRGQLKSFSRDLLSSERVKGRRIFKPETVQSFLDRVERGDERAASPVLTLLFFELWMDSLGNLKGQTVAAQ